jgi:type IV secretory pathway TrbD component
MEIPERCTVVFHRSANRTALLLGCDPIGLGLAFCFCLVVALSLASLWGVLLAIALFIGLRNLLVQMAAFDPKLFRLHFNSQLYRQGFWPAKADGQPRWRN